MWKKTTMFLFALTIMIFPIFSPISSFAEFTDENVEPLDVDNPYGNLNWSFPNPANDYVTSHYGYRSDGFHKGFDLRTKYCSNYNCSARSVASGKVVNVGEYSDRTYQVTIRTNSKDPYGKYLTVRYLHLKPYSNSVEMDETVYANQHIAYTGTSGEVAPHLHFDVNNANALYGSQMNESNTINPVLFWPRRYGSNAFNETNSLIDMENADMEHDNHNHALYDKPEYFFQSTLINFVGKDKFQKWFDSIPQSERTITNFKSHFGLTDNEIEDIIITPEEIN